MANFYVNEIHPSTTVKKPGAYIGLFADGFKWRGEGNFCGWYGVEYYDNARLLAYYVIENSGVYSPKGHTHIEEKIVGKTLDKIAIGSCYWESVLEADNEEEAIQKFFKEDFASRH